MPLLTARAYSAAQTVDVARVVQHVQAKFPASPLLALGFSLGSMILVKLVAAGIPVAGGGRWSS